MQSVELKVGRTVFAWASSPGHCHPQCWCAKAGMLSARTVAVMAAMVRDFIGFYPARAKPHWLESLKGDSGTIESVIRCPDRKMLGDGDGLAAGAELFGGSAGAGAGGG